MDFPERLKKLRQALGLSQKEFAERLGMHIMTISRYERGKINPSFKFLELLKEKFNVNPQWLLEGKGDMFLIPPPSEASKTELFGQIVGSTLDAVMEELAHKVLAEAMTERGISLKKEVALYDYLHQLAKDKLQAYYQAIKAEIGFQLDTLNRLWSSAMDIKRKE